LLTLSNPHLSPRPSFFTSLSTIVAICTSSANSHFPIPMLHYPANPSFHPPALPMAHSFQKRASTSCCSSSTSVKRQKLLTIQHRLETLDDFLPLLPSLIYFLWFDNLTLCSNHPKNISSFRKFIQSMIQSTNLSLPSLLLALYYIYKLKNNLPKTLSKNIGSEYRLFIVSLILSNKFLDDHTFTTKTWSELSGLSIIELNIMEREFLIGLDYKMFVSHEEFLQWKDYLSQCYFLNDSIIPPAPSPVSSRRTPSPKPYHRRSSLPQPYPLQTMPSPTFSLFQLPTFHLPLSRPTIPSFPNQPNDCVFPLTTYMPFNVSTLPPPQMTFQTIIPSNTSYSNLPPMIS